MKKMLIGVFLLSTMAMAHNGTIDQREFEAIGFGQSLETIQEHTKAVGMLKEETLVEDYGKGLIVTDKTYSFYGRTSESTSDEGVELTFRNDELIKKTTKITLQHPHTDIPGIKTK